MKPADCFRKLALRHARDEKGSISTMFALSALTILMAVGATYDVSQLQSSSVRSQQVADIVGLTATVYVKNHGHPPTTDEEGFVNGKEYSAKALGYNIGPATNGSNDVKFTVNYSSTEKQATVTMSGTVQAAFMGMFGQSQLAFNNVSVVKYSQSDLKDPASVFLVLDNSGSMAWDDKPRIGYYGSRPSDAQARIDGLKSTVKEFNDYLGDSITATTSGYASEYLRMGMTAYNSGVISSRTVSPRWGTLPSTSISSMIANGGTDSRDSMNKVYGWMQGESAMHAAVNGSTDPLKYVIFMTDGVNNEDWVCNWVPDNHSNYWRKETYYGYKYHSGYEPWGWGWEEGREECSYVSNANIQTLETCTNLKNAGVEIYTIGYALEPGTYATDPPSNYYTTSQSSSSADTAYNFLRSCASDADHFVKAENTEKLKAAFDKIGADIIADVVRIAS